MHPHEITYWYDPRGRGRPVSETNQACDSGETWIFRQIII